jgi:hypothetical protein
MVNEGAALACERLLNRRDDLAPARLLNARPDNELDFSDIPPLTKEFFKNAVRGKYYQPTKTSTRVRIDSHVLAWLKMNAATLTLPRCRCAPSHW